MAPKKNVRVVTVDLEDEDDETLGDMSDERAAKKKYEAAGWEYQEKIYRSDSDSVLQGAYAVEGAQCRGCTEVLFVTVDSDIVLVFER
jgi:hypothetical protein